jgi:hypothetical protein
MPDQEPLHGRADTLMTAERGPAALLAATIGAGSLRAVRVSGSDGSSCSRTATTAARWAGTAAQASSRDTRCGCGSMCRHERTDRRIPSSSSATLTEDRSELVFTWIESWGRGPVPPPGGGSQAVGTGHPINQGTDVTP